MAASKRTLSGNDQIEMNMKRRLLDSIKKSAVIIGTVIILLIALRNSVTWHLQRFLDAYDYFWQCQWEKVHDLFAENIFFEKDFDMAFFGTSLVTMLSFWFVNIFLIIIDYTGRPKFLLKYKVQEEQNRPVDPIRLRNAITGVLLNQIVVSAPVLASFYFAMKWRGCSFGRQLPMFTSVMWEFLVFIWVEEVLFYYSHRLMHHPVLYKRIHKMHHEWTAPIGITAFYCHPIEHIISNLLPLFMGPIVCGSHMVTAWVWLALAHVFTSFTHSGYHFPFLPSSEAHDFHHAKFNQNYGIIGVLDWLHGTDATFRQTKAYQRHFVLFSWASAKQMIPDQPNYKEHHQGKTNVNSIHCIQ